MVLGILGNHPIILNHIRYIFTVVFRFVFFRWVSKGSCRLPVRFYSVVANLIKFGNLYVKFNELMRNNSALLRRCPGHQIILLAVSHSDVCMFNTNTPVRTTTMYYKCLVFQLIGLNNCYYMIIIIAFYAFKTLSC